MPRVPPDAAQRPSDQLLMQAVKQCIVASPAKLPTLEELAGMTGVSKKQISDAFRRHLGITVAKFLREERMRRAQRLLVQTSLEVHVIAQELGFSSSANFSNAFREYVGMSPTGFREKAPLESITALQGAMQWTSQ
ncbi:helix-turn-helix transcriptional regulator [Pusillimonas sp. SM2304]|uniref:helix-turn-helix transcriptional regulator n=1 Tax=Pusillimonas sp. SM2304 TaxID=3073241 RepID=UPI002875BC0C|nr:helix-turn-helix transcriptional regulator [Pusillimonas sp. SM2304]MDS1141675.1 helix-turn-helix transcriptional regulator [Pusillimonas sp. SM2304]